MPTLAATSSFETLEFLCSSCSLFCFNFSSKSVGFFFSLFCHVCGGYGRCACENNTEKGFSSVHWRIQQALCWKCPAIVESWNKLVWKRPMEVIWSKLVLRVRSGWLGLCSVMFWKPLGMGIAQHLWATMPVVKHWLWFFFSYIQSGYPLLQIVTINSCHFAMNIWVKSSHLPFGRWAQWWGEISPPPLFLMLRPQRPFLQLVSLT